MVTPLLCTSFKPVCYLIIYMIGYWSRSILAHTRSSIFRFLAGPSSLTRLRSTLHRHLLECFGPLRKKRSSKKLSYGYGYSNLDFLGHTTCDLRRWMVFYFSAKRVSFPWSKNSDYFSLREKTSFFKTSGNFHTYISKKAIPYGASRRMLYRAPSETCGA